MGGCLVSQTAGPVSMRVTSYDHAFLDLGSLWNSSRDMRYLLGEKCPVLSLTLVTWIPDPAAVSWNRDYTA